MGPLGSPRDSTFRSAALALSRSSRTGCAGGRRSAGALSAGLWPGQAGERPEARCFR